MPVSEAEFHLFQVPQELRAGNTVVPFQFGLGRAPAVLDAVDRPTAAGGESFPMSDPEVPVALGDQPIVAGAWVRVDRAALGHLLADHRAKGLPGHIGHRRGVHLAAPLQKPEGGHFAGAAPRPRSPLQWPPKVGLVGFDRSAQRRVPFTLPRQVSADPLVDPLCTMPIDSEQAGRRYRRNLQGEEVNELRELPV